MKTRIHAAPAVKGLGEDTRQALHNTHISYIALLWAKLSCATRLLILHVEYAHDPHRYLNLSHFTFSELILKKYFKIMLFNVFYFHEVSQIIRASSVEARYWLYGKSMVNRHRKL